MPTETAWHRRTRLVVGPLALTLGATRWVGPALFFLFWAGLSQSGTPTITEVAGFQYLAMIPTATWFTHVVNGADDQRHREMHVAASGSQARVSIQRALASFLAASALGTLTLLMALVKADHRELFGVAVVVVMAAALTGVALAMPFSPPVTDQTGVALASGLIGFAALALLPPVQWSVRQVNAERSIGAVALAGGAVVLAAMSAAACRWLYRHRLRY